MDGSVARLNIEHYKRQIAAETDESRRAQLRERLAEEESKLAHATPDRTAY